MAPSVDAPGVIHEGIGVEPAAGTAAAAAAAGAGEAADGAAARGAAGAASAAARTRRAVENDRDPNGAAGTAVEVADGVDAAEPSR